MEEALDNFGMSLLCSNCRETRPLPCGPGDHLAHVTAAQSSCSYCRGFVSHCISPAQSAPLYLFLVELPPFPIWGTLHFSSLFSIYLYNRSALNRALLGGFSFLFYIRGMLDIVISGVQLQAAETI